MTPSGPLYPAEQTVDTSYVEGKGKESFDSLLPSPTKLPLCIPKKKNFLNHVYPLFFLSKLGDEVINNE
ncbi:hypothetical protein DFP93_108131 [Aneurinibacillus soli]|uniref:Uncharacterized protein n=1 Tax=Aneurinibacillus soli TaxID=1500254 RepID=A0A0U4WCD3_9BACL|nr:hypothetical protein DFP93_108131 [Aneurinibacillus soli]BAU26488.1 hypothetical protein CB4_00615 [Aneurinibacillus soli]